MNCIISGIKECHKFSVGGIKQLWIIPFDDIYNYTYTDDELGKVTSFKANVLPVEYAVIDAQFDEEYQSTPFNNYVHSLSFTVPKLSYQKRNELEKLMGGYVTIIFKDKNGLCWITGFDNPLKMNRHRATTGGDSSQYSISASGNSRYQVKECVCFNPTCFASFNGVEYRTSTFTIEGASLYDFGADWQVIADTDLLTYTPNQPLDPTNWSNPTIYAQDVAELAALTGSPTTSIVLSYDGGTDIATITFYSNDTSYDYLTFAGQTPLRSTINVTLNLFFVLTDILNAATTTVTVTDSDLNVVYTGNPFDPISGAGLSGSVGNALINVSELYPDGTTFTATVENSACETNQYTFVYENGVSCDVDAVVSYDYGISYELSIPKNPTFNLRYQTMIIHYDEWQFNIVSSYAEATDDFATIEATILDKLTSDPTCPIIPSSIVVTETPTTVRVSFQSTRRNSYVYAIYKAAYSGNAYAYLNYSMGKQSNLMIVQSLVNNNNYITVTNQATTDELGGQFGSAPDLNEGYSVEDYDGGQVMENIAFNINSYIEEEGWAMNYTSPSCPSTNLELNTAVCYDSTSITFPRRYTKYTLDVSGNPNAQLDGVFVFNYNIGATIYNFTITVLDPISGNVGLDQLSNAILAAIPLYLGDNTIKVLDFKYDEILAQFTLELDHHPGVLFNFVEANIGLVPTTLAKIEDFDIADIEFNPIINPHTNVDWSFSDVDSNTISNNAEGMSEFVSWRDSGMINFAKFNYNSGTNDFTVTMDLGVNQDIVTFELWDSSFNLLEQFGLPSPVTTDTQSLVSNPNDVAYVSFTTSSGGFWFVSWDAGTQSNIDVYIPKNELNHNLWGYMNRFRVLSLTSSPFTTLPTITSILCP